MFLVCVVAFIPLFFFFNDTATTEIYTLSLHDALPISTGRTRLSPTSRPRADSLTTMRTAFPPTTPPWGVDRKSTRLNSSHSQISYAVFCLKKKKNSTGKAARLLQPHDHHLHPSPCRSS